MAGKRLKRMLADSISRYLPDQAFPGLPKMNVSKDIRNGRSLYEGYQRGVGIEYGNVLSQVLRDPHFRRAHRAARQNNTHVSIERLVNLYLIIRYFMPGESQNIIEYGSYSGGSALFMALLLKDFHPGAQVYALDTFGGMPKTDKAVDLHESGDFDDANIGKIRAAAEANGIDNLHLVQGLVEDTAQGVYEEVGKFGLAHLDLDIYHPLKFAHESVLPYMAKGGYVVYDDATVSTCLGATQVVEDMIREHGLHCEQIYPHFVFRSGL